MPYARRLRVLPPVQVLPRVRVLLPDAVVADLRDNSAYWAEFEGPVNDAAQKVYDSFLKSSGESRGTQSYGTVVDMLMAYYG